MGTREKKVKQKKIKQEFSWQLMYKQRYLLLMSVPFVVWLIIFKYIPLWGWTMAFQDVKPATFALSFFERTFVGFDNFTKAFSDRIFAQTMINTIALSILGIALGTVSAIIFALMLNELRYVKFKKITQTISYLPHFVSWVVIASIAKMVFNDGGMLDMLTGKNLKLMSTNSALFWVVICIINVWKEVGWDAIVYLSAMAGIDQGLYEAAKVDGANIFQQIRYITIPLVKPTFIILLLYALGSIMKGQFELFYQMIGNNGVLYNITDILDTYVYRITMTQPLSLGLGTAAGLYQSIFGFVIVVVVNFLVKRKNPEYALF